MQYCSQENLSAEIWIESLVVRTLAPVQIEERSEGNGKRCWRFAGTSHQGDEHYELFACGNNPGFVRGPTYGGDAPAFNGVRIVVPGHFYYQYHPAGSGSFSQVSAVKFASHAPYSLGSCDECLESDCRLEISDSRGIVWENLYSGKCPQYNVVCGKGCPPNTCECQHANRVCCYNSNGIVVKSFLV